MKRKSLKTFVFGLTCFGMLAGASAAIFAGPKAAIVKAEESEYTTVNTAVTRVFFRYNSWLSLGFTNFSDGGALTNDSFAQMGDFNFIDNIYLNGDPTFKAFASTVVAGYHIDGNNTFFSTPNDAIKNEIFANVRTITIPAGTEFPSRGTVTGEEKVKYVTTEEVTFYNVGYADGNAELTHESKINYVETDVEMFATGSPNPTWPGFKLTVNDYGTSRGVIDAKGVYNYASMKDIQITNNDGNMYTLGDISGGISYSSYNAACEGYLSINNKNASWVFVNYKMIFIPKGTEFPSLQWNANASNPQLEKTIYYTTKDIIFYCNNQWGSTFVKVNPTFEDTAITEVGGINPFNAEGTLTNFVFNVSSHNKASQGAGKFYNTHWILAQAISNAEFYGADNARISLAADNGIVDYKYGAVLADYNGTNDYLVQLGTNKLMGVTKIVFKAGTMLPSFGYLAGENNVWYKTSRDYVFVNVLSNIGNYTLLQDFVRDYMHPEVAITDAGTGACTTSGWYNIAKEKFNAMTNADKVVFANYADFAQMWVRLNQWAAANGEAFNADFTFHAAQNKGTIVSQTSNESIIVIAAGVSLLALLGFVILKKKHQ